MIRAVSTDRAEGAFRAVRTMILGATLAASLAACGTVPSAEDSERLDSNTGTTVTLMPKPVEFIVDRARGPKTDPFAYLAPFETNRMGAHEMYLWVSAPQIAGPLGVPKVFCGEESIELEPATTDLGVMGISKAPYKLPAPWSVQWYFKLSGEVLDCFARAKQLRIVTQAGEDEPDRFVAEAQALAGLSEFATRVKT